MRFNRSKAGPLRYSRVVLSARDGKGRLLGGLILQSYWRESYIELLWLSARAREAGVGTSLIQKAEQRAQRRGSPGFLPQAGLSPFWRHVRLAEGPQPAFLRQAVGLNMEYYFEEGCYITELSNTPADPEASIARARVLPGVTTRWHRLTGTTERYVMLEGNGRVEVGDEPARDVGPGDVVVIPPLCRQRITNVGEGDLVFLAICTPRFRPECYGDC
jgi:mannose-6-phosphate isomerase-like protein (cupin superfamily)